MYRLDVYGPTSIATTQTSLFSQVGDFTVERWSRRINAPGVLVFSMHKFGTKATEDNLQRYRRVRLYRRSRSDGQFKPVWSGYIEAVAEVGERKEVICAGMLQFFTKRYTGEEEVLDGQGSTEAFGLLSDANTAGATGVSQGTGGVTSTKDLTMDYREVLRAWEELARAHGAEFEIDENFAFNFVPALGSDKSSVIELTFRRDGQPGSNVDDIEIGSDGRDMANRIIGTSKNGDITSTQNDATSQTKYGVLIERKTLNEANDQDTLDAMVTAYLGQRANPISDYRIEPTQAVKRFNPITGQRVMSGLQYEDVAVGDLVTVVSITGNVSETTTKRLAEIIVETDEEVGERLRFTLTEASVFVTAGYMGATEIEEIRRQIKEIQAQL